LRGAIAEAAAEVPEPLRRGWDAIVTEAARGSALAAAVDRWAVAAPGEGARLAAAALALGAELGGAAAAALDGVAATLRDRNAVRREIRALSSQARASALVIVVAPVGFTMIMALADPATLRFLVATPIGLACLTGGLVLDGLGAWWMHRITIGAAR
jgi:tight adherence protein B